jgi:hypothetical protein
MSSTNWLILPTIDRGRPGTTPLPQITSDQAA